MNQVLAVFGVPLAITRSGAYLLPGAGRRSLATIVVRKDTIRFDGAWRAGAPEPDIHVSMPLPGIGIRQLPVKDHHLLRKAESSSPPIELRADAVPSAVDGYRGRNSCAAGAVSRVEQRT
jgi:hypothetical protein